MGKGGGLLPEIPRVTYGRTSFLEGEIMGPEGLEIHEEKEKGRQTQASDTVA